MSHFDKGNYIFTTTLDSTKDKDDFVIELYSMYEDMAEFESSKPKKIIHNFNELISFFEELDEEEQDKKMESKEPVMT
jgi:hypothetical protein